MDTLNQRFGQVIRARRQVLGIGQESLADLAGLHRTYISMLERGLRNPSLEVIEKLAAALDTSMASLIGEVEEAKRGGGRRRQ